jgi:mannose/cellobiose epimerase-like protein (N-acyl-D-glucosamine 2-epimerase family)
MSHTLIARTPQPHFSSAGFLRQHIDDILSFYKPRAFDPRGGFFHYYKDDGTVYDADHRHLVSATRFVFNWVRAWQHTGDDHYRQWAAHALQELDTRFKTRDADYAWTVNAHGIEDARIMAYGQAFVLLAKAHAYRAQLCSAADVGAVFERMNTRFYEPQHTAYADERGADGTLSPYRGQNANMHMCEACLAAFEATGEARYLSRAQDLANTFALGLSHATASAPMARFAIWEHYQPDWTPDWDYNKNSPGDIFKPWGYQTGHQTEWAKLLLNLHEHSPNPALVSTAKALHDEAYAAGWDHSNGGLIYGYAPDGSPCDTDKYFWVQAESFASSWRLWRTTGEPQYLEQYRQIWQWAWAHLVDHRHGAWFRIVSAQGGTLEDTKSPAGKVDYHTMGACWDVLRVGGLD